MFFKACLMQKYAHNRKFTINPSIYCFVYSNILKNCAQQASTLRFFSKNLVSGVPKQVENAVRNRKKSLLSFCTATGHCSSKQSISSESFNGLKIKFGYSSFSSSERYFDKIRPNHNFEPVRSYSEKKVESILSEKINQFASSSDETWDAHNSSEPHGGLSNGSSFSQASDTVEDHFEAETDTVHSGKEKSYLSYRKPLWSVEYDHEEFLPSSATNSDKSLNHMIHNARTSTEVLDIYEEHQDELKFLHYDLIVRMLTAEIERSQFKQTLRHPMMVQLVKQLTRDCNQYDSGMLITLLKYIVNSKMSTNSPLVCTTLQMLRKQFNNLDLKQLLYVSILLKDLRHDDHVSIAIKMAIPLALEYRYRSEPLPSGLPLFHLIHGLDICTTSDTADSMVLAEKFMMILYEREIGPEDLHPTLSVQLIYALTMLFRRWQKNPDQPTLELLEDDELDVAPEGESNEVQAAQQMQLAREVLFKVVLQYIANNISKFTNPQVNNVLSLLSYSYSHKDKCAYNQPLLRTYARRAVEQGWSLRSLAGGVIWMLRMNELDESLLQALLEKIHSTSPHELQNTALFVMPLIHALASSCTFASRSEDERQALLTRLLLHPSARPQQENCDNAPVSRMGVDLACLGYFESDVHRKILDFISANIKINELARSRPATYPWRMKRDFLYLWQAHQLLNTKHGQLQVDDALLAACKQFVIGRHHHQGHPNLVAIRATVREMLQQALSSYGPNSVVTAVHTRHGVCVDHVIVVRGESEVVPQPSATESGVCLDDILVPDNARVLGVVQIGPSKLLNGHTKLRSQVRLHLQLLAAEGVTPVLFNNPLSALHYRTDEEKMRYLTAALCQHRLFL